MSGQRESDLAVFFHLPGHMAFFASPPPPIPQMPPPNIHVIRELLFHERLLAMLAAIFTFESILLGVIVSLSFSIFTFGLRAVLTAPLLAVHMMYFYVSRFFRSSEPKKYIIKVGGKKTDAISLNEFSSLLADEVVTKVEAKAQAANQPPAASNGVDGGAALVAPAQPTFASGKLPNGR
jgi:hypothetical protein